MSDQYCLIIYGTKQSDEKFRPGTPTAETHWAYRFVDSYIEYDTPVNSSRTVKSLPTHGKWPVGIDIVHQEDGQIVLKVTSEFMEKYEGGFESLMFLVKSNELTYEFPSTARACGQCRGHQACVYNLHKV